MYWIYDISTWHLGALFALVFVGLTCSAIVLTRPLIRRWLAPFDENWNEVIGNIVSGYGSLYGILLALIAFGAYQNFSEVDQTVSEEASNLGALYRDVSSYPDPEREELQSRIRDYCRYVVQDGWPEYRKGRIPQEGTTRVTAIQQGLFSFEPKNKQQEILHAETVHQFNAFAQARRRRLQSIDTGLPTVLWYVVGIGAFFGILLSCFFWFRRLSFHLTILGIVWLFTGLVVFLIAAMDYPLRGEVSISAEAFDNLLKVLMRPQ